MASALISAPGNKRFALLLALTGSVLLMMVHGCSSPLDLDVDRSKTYVDGSKHPTRLQLYYYFGDSAYEAIVTDQQLLESIWIEQNGATRTITIPRLQFSLPDTIAASPRYSPFVRSFCFSATSQPCDGSYANCVSPTSWVAGEFLSMNGTWYPYHWMADTRGRQIRFAFYEVENENLIKGSGQILVSDPEQPGYQSYRVLITLEY